MSEKDELQQIVHAQARACVAKFFAGRRDLNGLQTLCGQSRQLVFLCAWYGLEPIERIWEER